MRRHIFKCIDKKLKYTKVIVKKKNGTEKPITKLTKSCPVCGFDMFIEKHKEGGVFIKSKTYWACSETRFCKHRELEENDYEGYTDDNLN